MAFLHKGINKANIFERLDFRKFQEEYPYSSKRPCVFISHHKSDTNECRYIAQYIKDSGIDVYFDEYDKTLSELVAQGDSQGVTKRIQEGIDMSTNMLCVISRQTRNSYWVPFEIGYAYSKTDLTTLTLKGINDNELPDYLKIKRILRGTKTLNEYIATLNGKKVTEILNENLVKSHTSMTHYLDNVLDWNS